MAGRERFQSRWVECGCDWKDEVSFGVGRVETDLTPRDHTQQWENNRKKKERKKERTNDRKIIEKKKGRK